MQYICKYFTSASARCISVGEGSYNYVLHPFPPFKGNISITGCMLLSSLLKTIIINGSVECRWCMKRSQFFTNIWSITAGSSHVITIWMSVLAYCTWADDHVGTINNIHWWMTQPRISGQLFMMQTNEATSKKNCPKNIFDLFKDL